MQIDKREDDFNYYGFGSVDVREIASVVSGWTEEWFRNTHRQTLMSIRPGEDTPRNPHKDTQSYWVARHEMTWKPMDKYKNSILDREMYNMLLPIIGNLEKLHNGTHGQIVFIKLPAKKETTLHKDHMEYLLVCRRIHIPIITNANVLFNVGGETKNMKTGEMWEINNSKDHGVVNDGEDDRVHVVIDIIPNELFQESDNRNLLLNGKRF
jgi:hypothetical protein